MTFKEAKYWFNHNGASIEQEREMREIINEMFDAKLFEVARERHLRESHYGMFPFGEPDIETILPLVDKIKNQIEQSSNM